MVTSTGLGKMHGDMLTVGQASYRLAPLEFADLQELEAWVFTRLPDPIQIAKELARDLPPDLAKDILLEAYEDVKNGARKLGSPEANRLLSTPDGFREMLYLSGRKYQPNMTREDWGRVLARIVEEEGETLAEALSERNGGALPDPKAPSSSMSTGAPPTGGTSSTTSPSDTGGAESRSID